MFENDKAAANLRSKQQQARDWMKAEVAKVSDRRSTRESMAIGRTSVACPEHYAALPTDEFVEYVAKDNFEEVILQGDLDMLKRLIAIKGQPIIVNPSLIVKAFLLKEHDMVRYIMTNGLYDAFGLEQKLMVLESVNMPLKPSLYPATLVWAMKHQLDYVKDLPHYYEAIRLNTIGDDLLAAIDSQDVIAARRILEKYFPINNDAFDLGVYFKDNFGSRFKRNLRNFEKQDLAECFEAQLSEHRFGILNYAMTRAYSMTGMDAVIGMLIKHGASPLGTMYFSDFERMLSDKFHDGALSPLLDLPHVKKDLVRARYQARGFHNNIDLFKLLEDTTLDFQSKYSLLMNDIFVMEHKHVIDFINEHHDEFFPSNKALKAFARAFPKVEARSMLDWICKNNLVNIIKDERAVLDIKSPNLHHCIFKAAQEGKLELIEALIKRFANEYRDEFVFSKSEILQIEMIGQSDNGTIAQRLRQVSEQAIAYKPKPLMTQYRDMMLRRLEEASDTIVDLVVSSESSYLGDRDNDDCLMFKI